MYRCILHSFRILGLYSVSGLKCCSLLGASLISCKPGWCHYEVMGRGNLAGLAQVLNINENVAVFWMWLKTKEAAGEMWQLPFCCFIDGNVIWHKNVTSYLIHFLSHFLGEKQKWNFCTPEWASDTVTSQALCALLCVCVCRVGWGCCVSLQHLPPLCAFRVSQADNLNGSWGGQQIPFRMAARVSREFHSALKAIWEIKVESRRFERTSCGRAAAAALSSPQWV